MVFAPTLLAAALAAVSLVSAHPHPAPGSPEHAKLHEFQRHARKSLSGCQDELRKRGGVYERAVQRREKRAEEVRRTLDIGKRGPFKRDLDTVLNTDHHSSLTGIDNNTDAATLFDGNSSCVLGPETTQGPYYVDYEYVRWDIREDQAGVDFYVDVQLIDVNSCEPVPNTFIDFWHANATGVYSGINAGGNGDSSDTSNLNTTWLRGIQETDEDGVAQWLTIFPGHYVSRSQHIHLIAQQGGTVFENGTYKAPTVQHVGQIFVDQDLTTAVELVEPYASNNQELTTNAEDSILAGEAADIDPVVQYVLLGDTVEEGIFGFISLGIDTTAEYTVTPAASWTENGGVANPNSGSGGGGGGGDGGPPDASGSAGGPAPSGGEGAPSGAAPSASA